MGKTIRSQISHTSKITKATTTRQDTRRSNVTLTRLPPTPVGREIPMDTALEKGIPTDTVWERGNHTDTDWAKELPLAMRAWEKGIPTDTAWGSGSPTVTD